MIPADAKPVGGTTTVSTTNVVLVGENEVESEVVTTVESVDVVDVDTLELVVVVEDPLVLVAEVVEVSVVVVLVVSALHIAVKALSSCPMDVVVQTSWEHLSVLREKSGSEQRHLVSDNEHFTETAAALAHGLAQAGKSAVCADTIDIYVQTRSVNTNCRTLIKVGIFKVQQKERLELHSESIS